MEEKLLRAADKVAVAFKITSQGFCEGEGKMAVRLLKTGDIGTYKKTNLFIGNMGEYVVKHNVLIKA